MLMEVAQKLLQNFETKKFYFKTQKEVYKAD